MWWGYLSACPYIYCVNLPINDAKEKGPKSSRLHGSKTKLHCFSLFASFDFVRVPFGQAKMPTIDPKVFFANERTYLHWLSTSVTVGSIGSALLGFSGIAREGGVAGPSGFDTVRLVGLVLIGLSIVFTAHAMYMFRRRGMLLRKRAGSGYDESMAPVALAVILVIALSAIYASYVIKGLSVSP